MNLQITRDEAALLTDALAKAASRHESQARAVKYGRNHDLAAKAMRVLRSYIVEEIVDDHRVKHDRTKHL